MSEPTSILIPSLQKASKNWKAFDWSSKCSQWENAIETSKQSREAAQVARKQLAEMTKSFKKSVKNMETAGTELGPNEEATAKSIEQLAKLARVTVKAYQGKNNFVDYGLFVLIAFYSLSSISSHFACSLDPFRGDR